APGIDAAGRCQFAREFGVADVAARGNACRQRTLLGIDGPRVAQPARCAQAQVQLPSASRRDAEATGAATPVASALAVAVPRKLQQPAPQRRLLAVVVIDPKAESRASGFML